MSNSPLIRHATREDVPEILAMIQELAEFENASDRVLATPEKLIASVTFAPSASDPHPPQKYAKTFLLTYPGENNTTEKIAGMALYFYNYSTWLASPGVYLEDLFVRPAYRRKGLASLLLQRLAQESAEISGGEGRLEWNCLRWNQGALEFYDGIGGERQEEWIGIRVEGPNLRKLAGLGK